MIAAYISALAAVGAATVLGATSAHAAEAVWSLCLAAAGAVAPAGIWRAWSFAPETLAGLAILALLHARHAPGTDEDALGRWRTPAFVAGWLVLAIALVSPLCRMAAGLVSAHMVQLMLVATLAGALLAAAGTGGAARRVLRLPAAGNGAGIPLATALYGATLWVWHAPPAYALTVTNGPAHVAAYAALVAVSVAFWGAILAARHAAPARAAAALFATMVHTGLLGALVTFAPAPLYPEGATAAPLWGLTETGDQQIAGLVMWVPGGIVYGGAALVLLGRWLGLAEDNAGASSERGTAAGRTT